MYLVLGLAIHFILSPLSLSPPAILCPILPDIENGFITYSPDTEADFDQGTVATYTCNEGFNLQGGDRERTCQIDGTFSGTAPICTMIRKHASLSLVFITLYFIHNMFCRMCVCNLSLPGMKVIM